MTITTDARRRTIPAARYAILGLVAATVVAADQLTKAIASERLRNAPIDVLSGAVTLEYARNTGAAFSILRSGSTVFAIIAILVCVGIVLSFRRVAQSPPTVQLSLSLILGGAISNLVDRLRLGFVVDFVNLHWWPVFNLADSCIVVGALLLAMSALRPGTPHLK